MHKRQLTIINRTKPLPKIIQNITLIEIAREFMKEKELKEYCMDKINHVRLYKQMVLLVELVSGRGRKQTKAYDKIEAKSLLK